MKFLLSLSFLLFAAASSINASSLFAEDPTPQPIVDVHGAPLQFGLLYYISPAIWAWGGGVRPASANPSQPCPKVIRLTPEVDRGIPVVFSSAVQSVTGNITTGSELIINFYNQTLPDDEKCGGSNSTTWVRTNTSNLAVGGEGVSTVFRLSLGGVLNSYFLKSVSPSPKEDLVVVVDGSRNLVVNATEEGGNMSFIFQEIKLTEEDEDDKPVIIQMPRKMSV